jgi:glycosyltransferase involved in cell wall biosynthesis
MDAPSQPRYTVIIPTRNRSEYLEAAILTALGQESDDFELVVSDNHSEDGTAEMLSALKDRRLRVIRPPMPLAMVQHFEWVLRQAKGEWITVIGDDDGLMPFFFEFADALTRGPASDFDAIYGPKPSYQWPGLETLYGRNVIRFDAHSGRETELSSEVMDRVSYGDDSYFGHAQFYTGTLFRRSLLERIRARQTEGRIYHSFTPDASSVVATLLNTDKILKVGLPFAWGGSSPKSTGAQATRAQRHAGGSTEIFEDFKHLNLAAGIAAHPRFRSVLEVEGCAKVYFLESLYAMSLANGYGWHERFDDESHSYRLFQAVYAEQQRRKRRGLPTEAYDRLFADNGLRAAGFEALPASGYASRAFAYVEKQRRGLVRAIRRALPGPLNAFSHHCRKPGVYPTILTANAMLEEPGNRRRLRSMIDEICQS